METAEEQGRETEGETLSASTVYAVEGSVCASPHFLLWRVNLKWGGGRKGVEWKMRVGEGVGLKTWRTGRLETGDRGMNAYWH